MKLFSMYVGRLASTADSAEMELVAHGSVSLDVRRIESVTSVHRFGEAWWFVVRTHSKREWTAMYDSHTEAQGARDRLIQTMEDTP